MKRTILSMALILAATAASAAPWTYRGTLDEAGVPANGSYDLRVTLLNEARTASITPPITLNNVQLVDGAFSAEVDFGIDLSNAPVMSLLTEVQQGSSGFVALGDPTRFDPKAALAGICWDTEGNATIAPLTEYVGTPSNSTLVLRSGGGVSINLPGQLGNATDLLVAAKSSGDADADLQLRSRTGKIATMYVSDSDGRLFVNSVSGGIAYNSGFPLATQNNGLPVHVFDGRLQIAAAGSGATDTSGGMWLDDERPLASYVGRGDNAANWTGFFSSDSAWTALSTDEGAFFVNSTNLAAFPDADVLLRAKPVEGNANFDLELQTRSGTSATITVFDNNADLLIAPAFTGKTEIRSRLGLNRVAAANRLEVEGDASKTTAGSWLANSDRRIKTDIQPITGAIGTINRLNPVTFAYTDAYRAEHPEALIGNGRYYNVVAQEFQKVFPDAVKGSGEYLPGLEKSKTNEILQVDTYPALITTIAAVQELNAHDDLVEQELAGLRDENTALQARLEALEARLK